MKSGYDELAGFLTNSTGATHFIFTPGHRAAFGKRLEPNSFSEDEMRQYFNEFNATNEKENDGNDLAAGLRLPGH